MLKRLLIINLTFVLLLTGVASISSAKNLYRNEAHKFRITFQEGWQVKRGSYPDPVVIASDIKGSSINITTEKTDPNNTANALSLELIPELQKAYETIFSDVVISDQYETYICNRKALMVEYNGTYKHRKISLRMTILAFITINNGNVFTISCSTDSTLYRNYKKTFVDSVSTFVFEDYIIDRSRFATTKDLLPDNA